MRLSRKTSASIAAAIAAGSFSAYASAGTYQTINIDGNTAEWSTVPVATSATSNPSAPIDLVQLKMANDSTNIYFELTFGSAVNPQSGSGVFLAIDSDNTPSTGNAIYGSQFIGSNFGFQNDFPFTQTASSFNSGGSSSNTSYLASPFNTATTTQEIAIPINASQTDPSDGGYNGNIFPSTFTVEFYTSESTVSILGPFTYTIAPPAIPHTYALSGSGDYNDTNSWGGLPVPNGVGAEADFLGTITANHTVYSDTGITLGKIVFNNSFTYVLAGAGSLTLQTLTGSASVDAQAGVQKITLPTTIASNTTFTAEAGATLVIGGPLTINAGKALTQSGAGSIQYQSSITVLNGGSISLAATSHAASLSLTGASTATLITEPAGPKSALQLDALSIATGSTFDLNNGDLILHNSSSTAIAALLKSGFNGGGWNGTTGILSSAARTSSSPKTALGYRSLAGTFDGQSVTASDVVVKYTLVGDTDLSGSVNFTDLLTVAQHYAGTNTNWTTGDFNYDGSTNFTDLLGLAQNYTKGLTLSASQIAQLDAAGGDSFAAAFTQAQAQAVVPEPASLGLLSMAAAGALARRRRHRS